MALYVYISGPISGLSEADFTERFKRGELMLKVAGYQTLNPLDVRPDCFDTLKAPLGCNSGDTFEDGTYKHTWQCYMKADIIAMMKCNAICALPGWAESKGAITELAIAEALGYPRLHINEKVNGSWELVHA